MWATKSGSVITSLFFLFKTICCLSQDQKIVWRVILFHQSCFGFTFSLLQVRTFWEPWWKPEEPPSDDREVLPCYHQFLLRIPLSASKCLPLLIPGMLIVWNCHSQSRANQEDPHSVHSQLLAVIWIHNTLWGWRDGLVIKSTNCSCVDPGLVPSTLMVTHNFL